MVSNPSVYNGFENKFGGQWNVGLWLKVPIWHWGEGSYKVNAAKAEARVAQFRIWRMQKKGELQVNQSAYKVNEAAKAYHGRKKHGKGEENLRYATLLREKRKVIPLQAMYWKLTQPWLSAQSKIVLN